MQSLVFNLLEDQHARNAALTYARSIQNEQPSLADRIRSTVYRIEDEIESDQPELADSDEVITSHWRKDRSLHSMVRCVARRVQGNWFFHIEAKRGRIIYVVRSFPTPIRGAITRKEIFGHADDLLHEHFWSE